MLSTLLGCRKDQLKLEAQDMSAVLYQAYLVHIVREVKRCENRLPDRTSSLLLKTARWAEQWQRERQKAGSTVAKRWARLQEARAGRISEGHAGASISAATANGGVAEAALQAARDSGLCDAVPPPPSDQAHIDNSAMAGTSAADAVAAVPQDVSTGAPASAAPGVAQGAAREEPRASSALPATPAAAPPAPMETPAARAETPGAPTAAPAAPAEAQTARSGFDAAPLRANADAALQPGEHDPDAVIAMLAPDEQIVWEVVDEDKLQTVATNLLKHVKHSCVLSLSCLSL